jgi:hypothetical protein
MVCRLRVGDPVTLASTGLTEAKQDTGRRVISPRSHKSLVRYTGVVSP